MKPLKMTREQSGRCKLTDEDIAEIRKMRTQGAKLRVIAERFGVSTSAVSYWCLDNAGRKKYAKGVYKNEKKRGIPKTRRISQSATKKKRIMLFGEDEAKFISDYKKEYYVENKEVIKEKVGKYNATHKKEIIIIRKRYYKKHRTRLLKNVREYQQTHKEDCRKNCRKYYRKNKEKILGDNAKYYKKNKEMILLRQRTKYAERKKLNNKV